jgi:hypothetical protein
VRIVKPKSTTINTRFDQAMGANGEQRKQARHFGPGRATGEE